MKKIKVRPKTEQNIKRGYPLIKETDVVNKPTASASNQWVEFVGSKNNYLGTGYISPQNKGLGWVLSWTKEPLDLNFFKKKLTQAKDERSLFFHSEETTAFRVFNGEGDGIGGFTVDWYAGYLSISWYNEFIYQEKRTILDALQAVYPEAKGSYEKLRFQIEHEALSAHLSGGYAPEPLSIKENGVTYATYMNEGLMTGIFLDQKEVRERLTDGLLAGKSLLNTFSYTGAFSVAAALGGAVATTSVDLAKRSFEKTKEQLTINQLSMTNHSIVVMDVFNYFHYAQKKGLLFDCVLLDPPSFAKSKKHTFSVAKNYGELTAQAISLIAPNGLLIASTNAANVSKVKFQQMIEAAIQIHGRRFKQTEFFDLPADFVVNQAYPDGNYLKVFFYQLD